MSIQITKAFSIALNNLRRCYVRTGKYKGIIAGMDHFDDYWARDSFFASFGSLAVGDLVIVKENLDLFLSHVSIHGAVPRRLNRYYFGIGLKYLTGFRIKRKSLFAVYKSISGFNTIDSNSLLLIVAAKYLLRSNDKSWAKKNYSKLKKVAEWIMRQDIDNDFLIEEGKNAGWMDTIVKFDLYGKTVYSNVLAFEAFESWKKISQSLNISADQKILSFSIKMRQQIIDQFWNGCYLSDYITNGKRYDYFATDGNLLAIIFGIVDVKKSKLILKHIKNLVGKNDFPNTNYPAYPSSFVPLYKRFFGLKGYQNNHAIWLWLVALYIMALHKCKMDNNKELQKLILWVNKNQTIYEVYNPAGIPYHRGLWKSDSGFAWSSGMILYTRLNSKKF